MWVSITEQAYMLLYSLIIGAILGALYDMIRIIRIFLGVEYGHRTVRILKSIKLPLLDNKTNKKSEPEKSGSGCGLPDSVLNDGGGDNIVQEKRRKGSFLLNIIIFFQDILFFIIAALIVTVFVYHANNGRVRGFAFAGLCAGFFVYYHTAGRFVMLCSEYIVFVIKTAAAYIWFFISKPVIFIVTRIYKHIILQGARVLTRIASAAVGRIYTRREIRRQLRDAGADVIKIPDLL